MQRTWVPSLVQEDPACHEAVQSKCSRTCPPQGEAIAMRGLCATPRDNPCSLQLEKAMRGNKDPAQPKINKTNWINRPWTYSGTPTVIVGAWNMHLLLSWRIIFSSRRGIFILFHILPRVFTCIIPLVPHNALLNQLVLYDHCGWKKEDPAHGITWQRRHR